MKIFYFVILQKHIAIFCVLNVDQLLSRSIIVYSLFLTSPFREFFFWLVVFDTLVVTMNKTFMKVAFYIRQIVINIDVQWKKKFQRNH